MKSILEIIERMKKIENSILDFIDKETKDEEVFQLLIEQIKEFNILNDKMDLKTFLYLLSSILNNHARNSSFFIKIQKIFLFFKFEILNHFSSIELYKIYNRCPIFLLFLINEKIIEIKDYPMGLRKLFYLFPEEGLKRKYVNEIPKNFKEKQQIGENDSPICEIIRKDLIEEFIIYVNKNDYPLKSIVEKSYFETSFFLIENEYTTLIEYAAFFGSTQIFKYLYKNGVELTSSLWLYAIHSDNPEMIHLLEENEVKPPKESYEMCIKESIKCHHNDITNYILSNLVDLDMENIDDIDFKEKYKENIYSYSFHYYNFSYFPKEIKNKIFFYYACQYDYFRIVEYFLKTVKINIKEKII